MLYVIKNHLKLATYIIYYFTNVHGKLGILKYNENTTMSKFRNKIAEKIDIESRVLSEAFNTE